MARSKRPFTLHWAMLGLCLIPIVIMGSIAKRAREGVRLPSLWMGPWLQLRVGGGGPPATLPEAALGPTTVLATLEVGLVGGEPRSPSMGKLRSLLRAAGAAIHPAI